MQYSAALSIELVINVANVLTFSIRNSSIVFLTDSFFFRLLFKLGPKMFYVGVPTNVKVILLTFPRRPE